MRRSTIAFTSVVALLSAAMPAIAAKGGGGHATAADATCSVQDNVVRGSGLPTDEVLNFMVSDSSGTVGWVLGFTDDGTWNVDVPAPGGATTYAFVSRTWGPNGSKYDVFASCS
jgi:hypothetical protein